MKISSWTPLALAAVISCSPLTNSDDDSGLTFRQIETPDFVFLYTRSDSATMDEFIADMNAKLARLEAAYKVDSTPQFTVVLYPSSGTFQDANDQSWWVTGITRGLTRMEIVSPFAPNQVFDMWPDTRAEHMLAHLVARVVNPAIANSPRWLWEGLALYESGQKTAVHTVEFFKPDAQPALSQLNGGVGTPIMDVGYYLGEFLEATWGRDGIIELIEADGNLDTAFGLTGQAFIAQFVAFVRTKYGLPS